MTVRITCSDLVADDLRSRNRAEVFVHVESDFAILDDDRQIYAERLFPVVELAAALNAWSSRPGAERPDFAFESLSFEELGVVRIVRAGSDWQVGSVFEPETWSRPVSTAEVDRTIHEFVAGLRGPFAARLGDELDTFLT